jgi:hypothetical protein
MADNDDYQLSSGDGFRSSLQLLIPINLFFGGGVLRYPVPKWLLFLSFCGEWFLTACVFFPLFSFRQLRKAPKLDRARASFLKLGRLFTEELYFVIAF